MEVELSRIMRAIRRFWGVALVATLVLGGLSLAMGFNLGKSYTAEATLIVVPINTQVGNSDTIVQLSTSRSVLQPILADYGIKETAEEYAKDHLVVVTVPGTAMVRISVTDVDAQRAADIANDIAANTTSRSYEVGLDLLQRSLSNLLFERDEIDGQLATVNTQIEEISSDTSDLSSDDQVRLDQLQNDRLRLEQRQSDLESEIRAAERSIATFVEPVVLSDAAVPSENSNGMSPWIFGVLGTVLGGLVGAALMLWLELRDPNVRDEAHLRELVPTDSIMRMKAVEASDPESAGLNIVAGRLAGVARSFGAEKVALVSPRSSATSQAFCGSLVGTAPLETSKVITVPGLLDSSVGTGDITPTSTVLLIAEKGKTKNQDVVEVVETLRDLGVISLSAVLLD